MGTSANPLLADKAGLSLEQAPPITVPFRFFLTAPLFMLAAAVLLAWYGPAALMLRQAPATLALTHLLTLGVLTMVMCGALMQMLPVVAGSPVIRPRLTAALAHGLLTLGVPVLTCALLTNDRMLGHIAAGLLAGGFAVFILAAGISLARVKAWNVTVAAMVLAVAALAVAVAMGMILLSARQGSFTAAHPALAVLHPLWGLIGWVALLVIGVAYQVVPMFQITPNYPHPLARTLAGVLFALLLARSGTVCWHAPQAVGTAIDCGLAAGLLLFAIVTLRLQARRKRRYADPTVLLWRFGMAALALAAIGGMAWPLLPAVMEEKFRLLLGVVFIVGFVLAVMTGMLYKIVPFLVWFHLQSRYVRQIFIPNMKMLIPDDDASRQMQAWFAACGALVLAVQWPGLFTYPAAALMALAALWLEWNLWLAVRSYRSTQRLALAQPR